MVRSWMSTRVTCYRLGVGYWSVVYAMEQRMGVFPEIIVPGRSNNEVDRLYAVSWWQRVRLRFMLERFGKHPVFSGGKVGR